MAAAVLSMKRRILINLRFCTFLLLLFLRCGTCSVNVEELHRMSYKIDILDTPLNLNTIHNNEYSGVVLSSKYGQQYQCSYDPALLNEPDDGGDPGASQPDVVGLLKSMAETPCLIKTFDWWTYEFCYGRYIRQYHLMNGVVTGEVITLGYYASDFNWTAGNLSTSEEYTQRHHSQVYENGTVCDLTGARRSVRVKFSCAGDSSTPYDAVTSLSEPTTCHYVLAISTQRVCSVPFLRVRSAKRRSMITCHPLLRPDDYEKYMERRKESPTSDEEELRVIVPTQMFFTTSQYQASSDAAVSSEDMDYVSVLFVPDSTTNLNAVEALEVDRVSDATGAEQLVDVVGELTKALDELSQVDEEVVEQAAAEADDRLSRSVLPGGVVEKVEEHLVEVNIPEKDLTGDIGLARVVEQTKVGMSEIAADSAGAVTDAGEQTVSEASEKNYMPSEKEGFANPGLDQPLTDNGGGHIPSADDSLRPDDVASPAPFQSDSSVPELAKPQAEALTSDARDPTSSTDEIVKAVDDEEDEEVTVMTVAKSDDNADGHAQIDGSYLTWQGRGNEIHKITIHSHSVKVRVRQRSAVEKVEEEQPKEGASEDSVGPTAQQQAARDMIEAPTRKTEVRVLNAEYYNSDGRPVGPKGDGGQPDKRVMTVFQKNDDEIEEHARHRRLQRNYAFHWNQRQAESTEKQDNN